MPTSPAPLGNPSEMAPLLAQPRAVLGLNQLPERVLHTMPWGVLSLNAQGVVSLLNPYVARLLGCDADAAQGQPLAQLVPDGFPAELLHTILAGSSSPAPLMGEYFLPYCQQWVEVRTEPGDPETLVFWQDITRIKQKQQQFQTLAHNVPDVLTRWGPDLRLRYANPALEEKTGQPLSALLGKTFPEMGAPTSITGPYTAMLQQVFDTGQPVEHYNPFPTPQGERHYHSRLVPERLDGRVESVLAIARDITATQHAEAELRTAHDLLRGVLDAPNVGLSAMRAVRAADGQILDFEYQLVSRRHSPAPGKPALVGRRLLETYPELHPYMDRMRQVVETGATDTYEVQVRESGELRWYLNSNAKLGDGFVNVWTDITARKVAEQDLRDSKDLLHAIFNATLDSLEVFRSVRNEAGQLVDFEWVLTNEAAHRLMQRSDLVGKRLLVEEPTMQTSGVFGRLRQVADQQQAANFEQHYPLDGQSEWFHVAAAPLGDGIVVNWHDITVRKKAAAELLRLQLAQQQQLTNAVLDAQESERQRIAESLHNGLGQLLYATQLHLNSLASTTSQEAFTESKRKAEYLLRAAIDQTRTLSHQLTPGILQDFGLEVAVQDICRDFNSPQLRLVSEVSVSRSLPPSLALALYRMVQELINNVAKHAHATEASLHLIEYDGWLELQADDNGKGFDHNQPRTKGMGLNALRDRVKLLNGLLSIISSPGRGTHINIRIPLVAPTLEVPLG
jgi:two-component system NarL family sensor kinase